MPKKYLMADEWYPVCTLIDEDASNGQAEFTEDELADIRRIDREWNDWQSKIRERFKIQRYANDFHVAWRAE